MKGAARSASGTTQEVDKLRERDSDVEKSSLEFKV